jgi:hypothetical protein
VIFNIKLNKTKDKGVGGKRESLGHAGSNNNEAKKKEKESEKK